ncbi:MAG: GldG family protein [Defluviitaleaceae bacterium]|nr:GldG family protein [Defluviitaleaceae bacterium]
MKVFSLLKDKRFRYGTMSTAMMIIAVVVFVLVNLLADEFNHSRDLTAEQLYSLTSQSHRFLEEELDMDVTLFYVTRTGAETHMVSQLLAEYAAASSHITTETRDPMINPTFVHQFITDIDDSIPNGSVIVQSAQDFRVIRPIDMRTLGRNQQTGQLFIESHDAEREITRAIHAVTLGDPPVIYHITGSGEEALPPALVEFIESENFIVRTLDAVMNDIPESADMIFVTMPGRDWSSVKADRVLDYLANREGRAFFALGLSQERYPQLDRVLREYGLELGDYIIIEGDQSRTFMGDPTIMVPIYEPHDINAPLVLNGFPGLLLMQPTGINIVQEMRRHSLTIGPVLSTTMNSYGRHLDSDAQTIMQIPEDIGGPFLTAVTVIDQVFIETTHTTQLVVVANGAIMMEEIDTFIGGANFAFISSSLNWLQGQPPGIWVPARRPPGATPVMLSDAQVVTMTGISMGLLPIGLFAAGVFIWFRRRHS